MNPDGKDLDQVLQDDLAEPALKLAYLCAANRRERNRKPASSYGQSSKNHQAG